MNIAVVGSRLTDDKIDMVSDLIAGDLPAFFSKEDVLISGGAKGVDQIAAKWAKDNGIKVIEILPDWSIGRHAGFLRNSEIVKQCDKVVAFWDGQSKGTKDTITKAHAAGKKVSLIIF